MVKKQNYEKTLHGLNNLDVASSMTIDDTLTVSGAATFKDNVVIEGTLEVDGATFQAEFLISTQTLLKLGANNTGAAKDIGFYGKYVEATTDKFAGIYMDADNSDNDLDQSFILFKGLTTEPSNEVVGTVSTADLFLNVLRTEGGIKFKHSSYWATLQKGTISGDITITLPTTTGTLATTALTTALEAWRTDFNALDNTRVIIKIDDDNFGGLIYGYGAVASSLVQRNYQGDIQAKHIHSLEGTIIFNNGSNTLTLTEPSLSGDIIITLPATTGTVALTSITTALESWRTDFNNLTNGKIVVKTADNNFGEITDSSSAWNANSAWRTTFNDLTNGHLCKISSDNNFTSVADGSSNWNLTSLWRGTFNSNVSTGELVFKSDTDTIDGVAYATEATNSAIVQRDGSGIIKVAKVQIGIPSGHHAHQFTGAFEAHNQGYSVVIASDDAQSSGQLSFSTDFDGGATKTFDIESKYDDNRLNFRYFVNDGSAVEILNLHSNGDLALKGGNVIFDNGCEKLTLTEPSLSGDIIITLPSSAGTLARTADVAYAAAFNVRIDAESSGTDIASGGFIKLLGGTNISLSRSSNEITINETATVSITALEAWRTTFNALTNGEICYKNATDDFNGIAYSSTAGQASKLLQVDGSGYIQATRIANTGAYIQLNSNDITYFVPASSTNGVTVLNQHIFGVGSGDIRMTMDSLSGTAIYNSFIVRDSYTGSYNMIFADATNGFGVSTAGGNVINCPATGVVNIAGGGVAYDENVNIRGSNIVIQALTAGPVLGTITMTDASNVALSNATCGTLGATGLITSKASNTTAAEYSQFGTAKIGNHYTDYCAFQHEHAGTDEYAIIQSNSAQTFINSAADQYTEFRAGNSYTARTGGDGSNFRWDFGIAPATSIAGREIAQSADGGNNITNNYTKCVNLIAGTVKMGSPCRVNESCFYALRTPSSARAILNTTFDITQSGKFAEAVSHTHDYGTPTGYSNAVGDAFKLGEVGLRVQIHIDYGHWCTTGGFMQCLLVAYSIDDSGSYTWRALGDVWRYYMNNINFHQTFSQTVDFTVVYPYITHIAVICNNTSWGGLSTGTPLYAGVPNSNWGSYINFTRTELPYYE